MRKMTPNAFTNRLRTPRCSAFPAPRSPFQNAFTRTEALALLAILSLLLAIVLPALAHDRARSSRIICANNLRQIGAGFQLWSNDHGELPPWEITPANGGTMMHSLGANAWLHFSWISNELRTARVLLCPSDTGNLAEDFGFSSTGYLNANNRNTSTSYFLSHAFNGGQSVVFVGDRNIPGASTSCSRFPQVTSVSATSNFGWDGNLHNQSGNVARFDGRVHQYSNNELRDALRSDPISDRNPDLSAIHFLKPR